MGPVLAERVSVHPKRKIIKTRKRIKTSKKLDFLDLSQSLPFTHCKIVLRLEDEDGDVEGPEKSRTGWVKEEKDFVFYDSITSSERDSLAMWSHYSSSNPNSSKRTHCATVVPRPCRIPNSMAIVPVTDRENMSEYLAKFGLKLEESLTEIKDEPLSCLNDDENHVIKEASTVSIPPRIYTCPYCFQPFSEGGALIKHLRLHRSNMENLVGKGGLPTNEILNATSSLDNNLKSCPISSGLEIRNRFTCRQCSYSCNGKYKLTKHMIIHEKRGKRFRCSLCPSYFHSKLTLSFHEKYIHKNENNKNQNEFDKYSGQTEKGGGEALSSDKEAKYRSNYNIEIVRLSDNRHGGRISNKVFSCKTCPKKFSWRYDVIRHIRRVHMKERLFHCTECPASFFEKTDFQRHILTHRGIKLCKCVNCSKSFSSRSNLSRHLRRAHKVKK